MPRSYANNRIRELRLRYRPKMSMKKLGLAIPSQPTPSTIAKLETGTMALSLDYILEMASALNVDPAEIICERTERAVPLVFESEIMDWTKNPPSDPKCVALPWAINGENVVAFEFFDEVHHRIFVDISEKTVIDGFAYVGLVADNLLFCGRAESNPHQLKRICGSGASKQISFGQDAFSMIGRALFKSSEI